MDILVNPRVVMPSVLSSIRGPLTGVLGNVWTLSERLTTITWDAPRPIDPARVEAIRGALRAETRSLAIYPGDPYFFGKGLARIARLALIADQLGEAQAAANCRNYLKQRLAQWLNGQNDNPLRYETTWNGVCSTKGLADPGADFGMGYYNDHHLCVFSLSLFFTSSADLRLLATLATSCTRPP